MVTREHWTILNPVMLALRLTRWAVGNTLGILLLHQVKQAGIVIWELTIKIFHCVPEMLWDGLSAIRNSPRRLLCQMFYVMSRDNYPRKIFNLNGLQLKY
jgi:hypothetical protein